jgi:hypothetical protein
VANVRVDGIAVVLGPLLRDPRIRAAALVDVDSGMVLDAWSAAGRGAVPAAGEPPDLELLGAQHAEVVRCALALLRSWPGPGGSGSGSPGPETCEVVLGADGGQQHLVRTVPDPHGDRLALAVVVDGPPRVLDRVRRRLRAVSVDALTAGPSMTRRPVLGGWSFAMPGPDVPARPERPARPGGPAQHEARAHQEHPAGRESSGAPDRRFPEPSGAPAPMDPAPAAGPSRPAPEAVPVPALSRLDEHRIELPAPAQPGPSAPSVPHLRSVRPDRPTRTAPAVVPPGRGQSPGGPRPPSPPAALPAPAPPRSRQG